MLKKHAAVLFVALLLLLSYSFYNTNNLTDNTNHFSLFLTDSACLITIFAGLIVIAEVLLLNDVSINYRLTGCKPSKFVIKNFTKTELSIISIIMVTPKFRYVISEPGRIEHIQDKSSLTLEIPENSKLYEVTYINGKYGFKDRDSEFCNEMMSTLALGKVYFELHTARGRLHIPQSGSLTLIYRAILYLKSKWINREKIEVRLA